MLGNPFCPAQNIRGVRSEYAFINMNFIQDDPFQMSEEIRPAGMIGKDPHVEHVRICENDAGFGSYQPALLFWSVSVINGDKFCHFRKEPGKRAVLILCERFCRENQNCSGKFIRKQHLNERNLVT